MAVPLRSSAFPDVLDARMTKVFNETYRQLPDRVAEFFGMPSTGSKQGDTERYSQTGTFGDVEEFTGTVSYDDVSEGYDVTFTHVQYAKGFQIERALYDDDKTGIMDGKPRDMAKALQRTRQKHGASILLNNAFSVDSTWISHTENVALSSNSHTTRSGASTSTGFDNLTTAALSAVALESARISMRGFRGDRGERISVVPSVLLVPIDLEPTAWEIVNSQGKPDSANNNANFNYGFNMKSWEYFTDANNWALVDSGMMKDYLLWHDRIGQEFAMVEDFDTFVGKWRLYSRYSAGHTDWRWFYGAQVS